MANGSFSATSTRQGYAPGGHKEEEVLGREVREVYPAVEELGLIEVFQRVWRTGEAEHHPMSLYEYGSVTLWVENYVFKLPNGDLVAMYEDLTKQKRAEEHKEFIEAQLRQAQKMEAVGTLAGGIAHDFNNILAAIMGYGELAQNNLKTGEDVSADIAGILKGAVRARDLVRRILTFSRSMSQLAAPLDLNSIIANTETFLRDTLPRMIELQTELDADIGLVKGDKTQIEQVIINLATNARDAMPEGGRLLIKTAKVKVDNQVCSTCGDIFSGEYVRLRVKDSGSGMDQKTLSKAFDPFFTTKELGKGTGLGLSMIFGIVQGHKGHIIIDSAPGTGTTIDIYLSALKEVVQKEKPDAG